MKMHLKHSIWISLALAIMLSIGTVFAQIPIAMPFQLNPFESSPTTHTTNKIATYLVGPANAYDTDWSVSATSLRIYDSTTGYKNFDVKAFAAPTDPAFAIQWMDLKIRYSSPTTTNDRYRIFAYVGTAPALGWTVQPANVIMLQDWVFGANALATISSSAIAKTWHNFPEPTDGTWDATDLSNLGIRFETQMVTTSDAKTMVIYEVWATLYSSPLPPVSSTTTSIQPAWVSGSTVGQMFFADIYVMDVALLAGFEFTVSFDTNIITPIEAWSYWPFTDYVTVTIDDAAGLVSILATAYSPLVDTGWTGNGPLARIYFTVDAGGSTALDLTVSKIGQPGGIPITHTAYDGTFTSAYYLSFTGGMLAPTDPTGSLWHEDYPTYSTSWTLASWLDNGDLYLSASDQIDMTSVAHPGVLYWFHVDVVTTTIHFTFKAPAEGNVVAESEIPMPYETELPDPTTSRWHMIYPTYCRYFTITSWTDNGDGFFTPSDQFDFEFDDEMGTTYWAHLDNVTTDIIVSLKFTEGGVPEFPMGLGIMMMMAPAIAVAYLWRTRKKVTKQ